MNIAVVGMGKIGLPLAVQYAKKDNTVTGIDINPKTVELINKGLEPFPEEAHLKEYLADVVGKGLLKATLDYAEGIKNADVVVVVVPLFVNDKAEPEFSSMDQATALIGTNLKKGSLICYETTLPIGTTRNRFVPSLEMQSGLKVGVDFNVVFSPERVFTGRIFEDLRKYPKIVGGITQECTNQGVNFYKQVLDFDERADLAKPNGVWAVECAESAEFVKLAETTYRDVNIALANQFAMHALKKTLNVFEIIEAANSQPFSNIHIPGISVGGHCIPVYPQFYLLSDVEASLIKISRNINDNMPNYFIQKLLDVEPQISGKNILISGICYRDKVKESYNSGALKLVKILQTHGANVFCEDELFTQNEIKEMNLETLSIPEQEIDILIIHTTNKLNREISTRNFKTSIKVIDPRSVFTGNKFKGLKTPQSGIQDLSYE
jgi:UDP-N-acetyl-D-glucosamine dehydrogenase